MLNLNQPFHEYVKYVQTRDCVPLINLIFVLFFNLIDDTRLNNVILHAMQSKR